MRLLDILSEERVTTLLTATRKDDALVAVARLFADSDPSLSADDVLNVLRERERLASTGVGSGVAIPHGRIGNIDKLRAAMAVSHEGIPFDAIDGEPVRIIVAVLAPSHHTGDHLRVLARVSRLLRSADVRQQLTAAPSPHAAFEVIARADAHV
jgi:PTS system nitrogen regulatory IIA component